jgi:hypothetical protein
MIMFGTLNEERSADRMRPTGPEPIISAVVVRVELVELVEVVEVVEVVERRRRDIEASIAGGTSKLSPPWFYNVNPATKLLILWSSVTR